MNMTSGRDADARQARIRTHFELKGANMTSTSSLSFEHRWGRAIVSEQGGGTDLLIRIVAGSPSGRQPKRAPVDVAFILDRSGSMGGEKIQVAKHAVDVALDRLQE